MTMHKQFDDLLLFLGRVSFAVLFIPNGLRQLADFSRFAAGLARHNLPFSEIVAALALIAELLGPILVLLGYEVWLGCLLLGLFCIAASLTSHRYWEAPAAQQASVMLQFYKNFALVGGLMFLFVSGPGKWSLEGRIPSLSQRLLKRRPQALNV